MLYYNLNYEKMKKSIRNRMLGIALILSILIVGIGCDIALADSLFCVL
jgi:hypothetical protein